MSTSSFDEKEKEYRLGDPQAAVEDTREYEPIKAEPHAAAYEKDLEANVEKRNTKGDLSRLQSGTSALSEVSSETSDVKSSASGKKKWYNRANPLRWGRKPPVPETRGVCPEYHASWFSLITFQWMAPLMTVSEHTFNICPFSY